MDHASHHGTAGLIDAVRESLQQHSAGSLEIVVDDLDKLVDDSIDRAVLRALDDPDLTPLRRSILASSTLTALPEESSNIERSDFALSGVSDIVAFTHTMIAAGFLDPSPDTGEDGYPRKWCYPEPVRASLRRIAEDRHPTDLRATETATIDALLHAGKPHAALTYAIDGGQWERALHIVDEHWTTLYTGGFLDTLGAALVERIPAEIADTHPTSRAIRRLHRQFSAPRDVPVVTAEPDVADGIGPEPAEVVMRAVMLRIDGRFLEPPRPATPLPITHCLSSTNSTSTPATPTPSTISTSASPTCSSTEPTTRPRCSDARTSPEQGRSSNATPPENLRSPARWKAHWWTPTPGSPRNGATHPAG